MSKEDRDVLLATVRGQHFISGFRHADLKSKLPQLSSSKISRHLKRLRIHGVIKRIAHCYKYYLTELGRRAVLTGLKLRELFVIPDSPRRLIPDC